MATFTVANTGDNSGVNPAPFAGTGTFRQAIVDSDATPGSNSIGFNIPEMGVQTISLNSALPSISVPVLIDGTTQPGYSSAPLIDLDGTSAGSTIGLTLDVGSDGSTIRGLVINNFTQGGILIVSSGDAVESSFIGTNSAGTAAGSQAMNYGIEVTSSNNTIGGITAGTSNVISANMVQGVNIQGATATGNLVEGNLIGTNAAGNSALPNLDGVDITGVNNTVGGSIAAARNVISGNSASGVAIELSTATGNVVAGNLIGTDISGLLALGNGSRGVLIADGASGNRIGTDGTGVNPAAERNVISANGGTAEAGGILIVHAGANNNVVAGNYIGTDVTGMAPLGNQGFGVRVRGADGAVASNFGNRIGTNADGVGDDAERNVIAANAGVGLDIPYAAQDVLVAGNYIGTDARWHKSSGQHPRRAQHQ
jgi:hypothetical protein